MDEKMYDEVGANYRFFLKWRHASFAGILVVIGGVLSLCVSAFKDAKELLWLIPLVASPIGILLWIIDVRTRELYHAAINAGKTLENGTKGFYTLLADEVRLPLGSSAFIRLSQSMALDVLFFGSSIIFVALAVFFAVHFGI